MAPDRGQTDEAQIIKSTRMKVAKNQYLVPSVKRCFDIIDLLADTDRGLTVSEIHRELRLPLSSAAAILYTLQSLACVQKNEESGRYFLGTKIFSFSNRFAGPNEIVRRCHSLLEQLSSETRLTAHIAVMHQGESMYIDRVAGPGLMQISSYIGMRWPLHVSGVGKVLLAFLPMEQLLERLKVLPLNQFTPYTVTGKQALRKQIEEFRRLGYGWELNEGEPGVGCVAAPIFGSDNQVVAAVSVTGSTHQINESRISNLGSQVKKFAQLMSKQMESLSAPTRHMLRPRIATHGSARRPTEKNQN